MVVIEILPRDIPKYKLQINDTIHELTEYELIELRNELLQVVPIQNLDRLGGRRHGGIIC